MEKMKTWSIEGFDYNERHYLKRLIIESLSFDEALEIAREVNKFYNSGCVIKIEDIPVEEVLKETLKGGK